MAQVKQGTRKSADVQFHLQPVTEGDRLDFAKWLLFGIGVLLVLGGVAAVANDAKGQKIFDACTTILPPVATLVIGYFFSQRKQ